MSEPPIDAPCEFTQAQLAGRERMPCIGHRDLAYRSANPCEYPSIIELVVHEPGTGARLVAPVCFTHAAALMHGEPADLILDLHRYRLEKI